MVERSAVNRMVADSSSAVPAKRFDVPSGTVAQYYRDIESPTL